MKEFQEVAYKSPADRARDAILEKHGLDDKSYAAMSPEARKALDAEIAEAVRQTANPESENRSTFARYL